MRPLFPLATVLGFALLPSPEAVAAANHLTYYGGPVISNPSVVVVSWGPNVDVNVANGMPGFYSSILDSPYLDWVSEYSTVGLTGVSAPDAGSNQRIGRGSFYGSYTITPSLQGSALSNTQILTELQSQIASGNLPQPQVDAQGNANTVYMVNFPPGVTITTYGGSTSCELVPGPGSFCGTTDTLAVDTLTLGTLTAGVGLIPDQSPDGGCFGLCGTDPNYFNDATEVHSHVLLNLVTNVGNGLWFQGNSVVGPPLAWYSAGGTEHQAADFCNLQPADAGSYTVETGWSNLQGACVSAPASPLAVCTAGVTYCRQCSSTDVGQDGGCTGATAFCEMDNSNTSFGQCVGCTAQQGCSGTTPVCAQGGSANDTCRACNGDAECTTSAAGPYCQTSGACGPTSATAPPSSGGGCSNAGGPASALGGLLTLCWLGLRRRTPVAVRSRAHRRRAASRAFPPRD